jgi:cytochrome c-type biogenesis protein CcmH/NrfG
VLLAMGHVTSAIACYEAALRLRPDFAEALDNLAYARQLPPSP